MTTLALLIVQPIARLTIAALDLCWPLDLPEERVK